MKIVWDEPKRAANLIKHKLDFAMLDETFLLTAIIRPAKLSRFRAIGRMDDGAIAVIFARLGVEGLSVISMRPANYKEREELP